MSTTLYRPGTYVEVTDQPGPVSAPTDTDAWFVTGVASSGPIGRAVLVHSLDEFTAVFGPRRPDSLLYDSVETFLRDGGARCYVSRVEEAGGTAATADVLASDSSVSLSVSAAGPGSAGNDLSVTTTMNGTADGYVLTVSQGGTIQETSPEFTDPTGADAQAWALTGSTLISIEPGAGAFPADATTALTGGTDGTPTDQEWEAALTAFTKSLGPGQVSAPGRTTSQSHLAVLAHAATNNRVALLDGTDTADVSALVSLVSGSRVQGEQDHYGGLFAPWAVIQGLAPGTTRQVPWSPIQAGIYARNERAGLSPGTPGAGQQYGRSRVALALTQRYSDADRDTLTKGGVNTARADLGVVESYGHRTIIDAAKFPQWRELGQVRLLMAIVAEAEAIAEAHLFAVLDGRRHEISKFGGELTGMLIPYFEDGSLYGDTPEEAFRVDVGQAVNTEATIANGELRAVIGVRCSHMAELVYIEIVKTETTQAL